MGELVKVAAVNDIAPGTSKLVEANGQQVAVFNVKGSFYAIDNTCAHRGGPLCEGFVNDRELTVECPWHGWVYSLESGVTTFNPDTKNKTFPVTIKDGAVFLEL